MDANDGRWEMGDGRGKRKMASVVGDHEWTPIDTNRHQ